MERQRWTQDRRRKQPSLYDEYLNEERSSTQHYTSVPPDHGDTGSTIRAVTPDSINEEVIVQPRSTNNFEREFLALSSSPTASSRSFRTERMSPRLGPSSMGRPQSSRDSRRKSSMGSFQVRSRTHTLQESGNEPSTLPPSTHRKGSRAASVSHSVSMPLSSDDDAATPNGRQLPSSISQPLFGTNSTSSSSQQSISAPSRPKSSDSNSASSAMSGPLPSPNAKRVLHLMKTLCGRMSGNVAFRKSSAGTWAPVYCYIKEEDGSLMIETAKTNAIHKTLVPDLRGCQVKCLLEESTQRPYLEITLPRSGLEVHIRVATQSDLDSWFAALLCWQPIRPKGFQNRMAKPQAALLSARLSEQEAKPTAEHTILKEAPVIKVGRMIFWDANVSFPTAPPSRNAGNRPPLHRMQSSGYRAYGSRWWQRVSCTLRENGELKLFTEAENQLVSVVQLSQLSRSAIQRLDSSVLESEFCLAIYPQYTSHLSITSPLQPIYLSLESRILYEVWFVLLRAFTIPQLYGPSPPSAPITSAASDTEAHQELTAGTRSDMFRMERALAIKVIEAKLYDESVQNSPDPSVTPRMNNSPKLEQVGGMYVEVHLDGEPRAKTQVKQGPAPFWAQEFDFLDLPAVLTSASVVLKHRPPDASMRQQQELRLIHEAYGLVQPPQSSNASSGYNGISHDQTLGKVEIILEELEARKDIEQRWGVIDNHGQRIGEILIRARAEENVILMRQEYEPLGQLLHAFENGLTVQIAQSIPTELKRLSDCLLNIFQVSGRAVDWLMALVEDEIDGPTKETPLSRIRYERMGTADHDSQRDRVVRDMNKSAALEANLLFRGNTLLTKALDAHMRRTGGEYLGQALGAVVLAINERDPECEVDPNRVASEHEMKRNWSRLISTTEEVWNAIHASAPKCPNELRFIFRHIKACAEDRYGDFLRSVIYSSVSGFLFLRFFVPAILNPRLFGLLKDEPKPRAKRTLVLIAKSLQTLANLATFGTKEPWMEPMNVFLNSHRDSFKKFIENICFVPQSPAILNEKPPSYSTPNAIRSRLPSTSKEGFPSLPFLLDDTREFASLVDLWLHASSAGKSASNEDDEEGPLHMFHNMCTLLHVRTMECLSRAERAERPTSDLDFRWEELIESLQGASALEGIIPSADGDTDGATPLDNGEAGIAFEDVTTPIAHISRDLVIKEDDPLGLNISPGHKARRDWEAAPDGGAASAAASILSQDRNPRSGFILPSSSSRHTIRASAFINPPGIAAPDTTAAREAAASIRVTEPQDRLPAAAILDPESRPVSAMSSAAHSTTSEDADTALPSLSREQERRDRVVREEKQRNREARERERQRIKDIMGGLGLGKRSRKDKERDKDKDKDGH